MPSVLRHCWLGVWKSIRPLKIEWWGVGVVVCLECRLFAYGPADATAIPKRYHLLPHLNQDWFYLSDIGFPRLFWKRGHWMGVVVQRCNGTTLEILWLHITRSAADEDHQCAVAAAICQPPSDWKRPPGRPNHTWLGAIEADLRPLNIGPSCVWKKT